MLIDFEKSIIEKNNITSLFSVIERHSYAGLRAIAKSLVSPPKSVTAENVQHMLNLLFKEDSNPLVLIIGGGTIGQGMESFYDDPRIKLVSFDIYASDIVQFIAYAHNIPLSDNRFDAVIVQAVLEHVLEPDRIVTEIHQILKSKGIVYSETSFLQHVHEGAYDFTRFTDSGHRYLFRKFKLIKSGASAGAGTQ